VDKPAGWAERYADAFRRDSVADEYHRRPPYPEATFDLLESLVDPAAPAVLDAGCGTGELGRRLVRRGLRVDAVDRSEAMVEHGRAMARGADPGLRWIVGNVETADLDPSYGLVVCGDSIHWFDWQVALPRICDLLSPRAFLAVVQRTWLHDEELLKRLSEVYARHGTNRDFRPRDAVVELANRGYFEPVGERTVPRDRWRPTLTELIGCHHSQSSFARDQMADPDAFDREVSEAVLGVLEPDADGRVDLFVDATVVWGRCPG
jgi:SAM-dependent methyltransferase